MLETSVRLLHLLSLLQSRREWSGADLAARLEVTTRTVRNDVDRLRTLGYQVDSSVGTGGGYRLGAGRALPPLLLDDEEAVAVALGLRAAAGGTVAGLEDTSLRALAKLEQTLPSRLRHRIDALRSATVAATGGGPVVDVEVLTTVAATIRDSLRLRFDYRAHDGGETTRTVEPHRLVYTGRRWYLLAWDPGRGDWRNFRADRITPRPPHGPAFAPREPPTGDAVAHVLRGVRTGGFRHRVRVRLHAPAAALRDWVAPGSVLLTPLGADECELETGADDLLDLTTYLNRIDVPFTVLEPAELKALLAKLADRYRAAAGGTP